MKLFIDNKLLEKLVLCSLISVSILAIYVSFVSGTIVAYNDAAAHLNTARRMIDNLTPGVVQIGSVWLPLLHILEVPFVANTFLWKTGLAGSLVSGTSFVIAGLFLYKLLSFVTQKRLPAIVGVIIFAANINLLYLQTTAMFEPLLMATAIAAIFFLTKWARDGEVVNLLLGAFCIMLATLTRYDGWAMFMASGAFVLFISLFRNRKGKEGALLLFLFLAGFGIFLWLLYNQLIFSDPLYFQRSEFSAAAQQNVLEARGQLPTKHNMPMSFLTYTLAVVVNNGLLMSVMLVVGVIVYMLAFLKHVQAWKLTPLMLLIPYAFNILTLYLGQSVIWMPMLPPHFDTYFNARYGLLMLPAIAFFVGFMAAARYKFIAIIILVITGIQFYLFLHPSILPIMGRKIGIITLQDTVSSVNGQTIAASTFLRENHTGGLIFISSASADAFIYRAGIPLKYYITEGTGQYWRQSLKDPRTYASYLVFFNDHSDRVGKKMATLPYLEDAYKMVYKDATYQIWKRN